MSGGVDSSVTAALLVEQGHEVIGVHMKLHDAPTVSSPSGSATPTSKTCCGLDDALDARRVADTLGIPYYVWDLRTAFESAVMSTFAEEYRLGRTPNPCVLCNGVLKFDVLLRRARALGASHLATGHYARITEDGRLKMAVDLDKDQSYFLFPMRREAIDATLFPLGGLCKADVRAHAARLGLVTAAKPESQDVCFLPAHDHARFVAERFPEVDGAGEIVDEQGKVLGHHDGYWRFTIGQRRGLGVAAPHPLYVLRVEPDQRRVVVGPEDRLATVELHAVGVSWLRAPAPRASLHARVRHRGALAPVALDHVERDTVTVRFQAPARAATPGQAIVFYDGDEVLGGGWIRKVFA